MGTDALATSGITTKLLYLLRDRNLTEHSDPLAKVRKSRLLLFLGIELVGFGATMAITQTIGKSSGNTHFHGFPSVIQRLTCRRYSVCLADIGARSRDRIPGHHRAAYTAAAIHHPTVAVYP